jgi:hypothetical protein
MINRYDVITRHNPCYTAWEKGAPLSIGNGVFCFTADFTGLQTLYDEYAAADDSFPLCTMAEWGWHSYGDAPRDESLLRLTPFDTYGREVSYAVDETGQEKLFRALRQNAHKFHLGKIGFELGNRKLTAADCKPVKQTLHLWEGLLSSEFTINGKPVSCETFVHPFEDTVYLRVTSPSLSTGALQILLSFPYGSHEKTGADFNLPHAHKTLRVGAGAHGVILERVVDRTRYRVTVGLTGAELLAEPVPASEHTIRFGLCAETAEFFFRFEPLCVPEMEIPRNAVETASPSFAEARARCAGFWKDYWNSGGAMDFSGSGDCRAGELERRIVLSRYLTAIQSRGTLPPAETGLTCNRWYG